VQAQVIQMHYGLDGIFAQPARDCETVLGLAKHGINRVEIAALVWLRQPLTAQELRSLLAPA